MKFFKKENFKKIFSALIYIFALIGFFLVIGFFAVKFGLTNTKGIIDTQTEEFRKLGQENATPDLPHVWNTGAEWDNFQTAIKKDTAVLTQIKNETGISPRLIISVVIVEQLRLYYSDRQVFKNLFEPLKILGTQTQFSWGIAGIKEQTAIAIENNLKSTSSPYYLGPSYEHALDFKTEDINKERFTRITDYKDRYYAYLYTALYIKESIAGWQKAGVDISNRPEIIATLFNIGFNNSKPNPNPQVGGAAIEIGGKTYSFGGLAGEFYYSNELTSDFPRE